MRLRDVLNQAIAVIDKIVGGVVDPSPLEIDPVSFGEGDDMRKARRIKMISEGGAFSGARLRPGRRRECFR